MFRDQARGIRAKQAMSAGDLLSDNDKSDLRSERLPHFDRLSVLADDKLADCRERGRRYERHYLVELPLLLNSRRILATIENPITET